MKYPPKHFEMGEIRSMTSVNDNHKRAFSVDGCIFRSNQLILAHTSKKANESARCVSEYLPVTLHSYRNEHINGPGYRNYDRRHLVVPASSSMHYNPAKWEYPSYRCTGIERCAKHRSLPGAFFQHRRAVVPLPIGP